MEKQNEEVDLYDELRKTLSKSEEEEPSVPSDEKPKEEAEPLKDETENEQGEMSEEEISKLTPRAQKRIRELAEQVKELAEQKEITPQEIDEKEEAPQTFKDVKEFLEAVEDEPSRKLLEKFYNVIKGEMSNTLAPIEQKNNEVKFDTEFAKYEKIEGLSSYKNDLKKTFLRNPTQSLKALIGETVADIQLNKVKSIEKTPSSPNRDKVDTSNMTKEQLYEILDNTKP